MNDRISLAFHVVGCLVLLRSIILLSRQKAVRGVSLWQAMFFASWSCWNLFFYDTLGLVWSWYGAVVMAALNCSWVSMLCWFKWLEWLEELAEAFEDSESYEEQWYHAGDSTVYQDGQGADGGTPWQPQDTRL